VDQFALLILDIRMPGVSGIELARMIKERRKTAQVPIIFLTAYYNEDQHVLQGYGAGAVDYLHKPVNPDILRSKVAVFAELHRMQQALGAANRALLAEVTERRRVQEQLRELNESLEQRVSDRTQELRTREEHIRLLLNEVNHRSRNLLSVVLAIARQTTAPSQDEFVQRLSERLQALAANHDLLARNEWRKIAIVELVRAQLAHFEHLIGQRISIEGPSLHLSAAGAQCVGMIVHELATNAIKHGALSDDVGRVAIAWQIEKAAVEERFAMSWIESGGPPVVAPGHSGFGSTVIKRIAELSLDGEVQLVFAPSGLIWRLACPVRSLVNTD
jgi:two-component sensor histidine kinase